MRQILSVLAISGICISITGCASTGPPKTDTVEFNRAGFSIFALDWTRAATLEESALVSDREILLRNCKKEAGKEAALGAADCARVTENGKAYRKARPVKKAMDTAMREAILTRPVAAPDSGIDIGALLQRAIAAYLSGGMSEGDDVLGAITGAMGK